MSDFGIATECGIGRARTPEVALQMMKVHAEAARAAVTPRVALT